MSYEDQYMINLSRIRNEGTLSLNERTGIRTLRVPSTQIVVDLEKEFPILQSKTVNWKVAIKEILWMMQKQSNKISELGAKIWDQWAGEDGTIGKSYGYQVGKPVIRGNNYWNNQVCYILDVLAGDPSNRQCVIDMWNVSELDEMNLVPCAYSSIWSIIDGRLNCMLVQRSADYPVGVPFDTTEYAALTHMFARHLGVRPGILTHVMADSHIYENQIDGVDELIRRYKDNDIIITPVPHFHIREGADSFWHMKLEDFEVSNYHPLPAIKFEVAV